MRRLAYLMHVWLWKHSRNQNDITVPERGRSYTEKLRASEKSTGSSMEEQLLVSSSGPFSHPATTLAQVWYSKSEQRSCAGVGCTYLRPKHCNRTLFLSPWRNSHISPDFTLKPLHVSSPPYFDIWVTPAKSLALKIILC